MKDLKSAKNAYEESITANPLNHKAYNNLGVILNKLNSQNDAIKAFKKATNLKVDYHQAYFNLGSAYHFIGLYEEARQAYEDAIRLKPNYVEALCELGSTYRALKNPEKAICNYLSSIDLNSLNPDVYCYLGIIYYEQKKYLLALQHYDVALNLDPNHTYALCNKGNVLSSLYRFEEALKNFNLAIEIDQGYGDAYYNRGKLFADLRKYEEANIDFDCALKINPFDTSAIFSKGSILMIQKKFSDSYALFHSAIDINPDLDYSFGFRLQSMTLMCDWHKFEIYSKEILEKVKAGRKAILSFPLLALTDSLEIQRKASEIWAQDKYPFDNSLGPLVKRDKRDRIRIGYYSADFHSHATANLMAGLFEGHDRSKFELFAFSFGPDKQDSMRQRLTQAFDQFIDVRSNSDKEVAEFSRMLGIDIAVDLKGSTKDHRFGIFSYRAAPVQISYIGYPGTMGADYIDYLIADKTVVPEAHQKHYAEKIIYLPDSYQVNDRKRVIADKTYTREELGLPIEGFVFCCFNNNYKITPAVFDGWMRILKAVPRSVLWLFEDNHMAAINLRKEAAARGIDEDRLVFAKPMPLDHHLARHSAADLFLDTTPVNAHTTASDALWAGLPLLTCIGESFASRVAASLLQAVGMPEFIANTQEEYEEKAIGLAQNPAQLKALRQKLQFNRLNAPLFNTEKITSHIEKAYANVYERYHADLMPENIYVENSI